jgi:hypothetical protein
MSDDVHTRADYYKELYRLRGYLWDLLQDPKLPAEDRPVIEVLSYNITETEAAGCDGLRREIERVRRKMAGAAA